MITGHALKDIIKLRSGFQTSVNISYDLGRDDKIKDFIPTSSTIDTLETLLLAISPSETRRAKVLVGAYGKGKSHLILILLSLLQQSARDNFVRLFEFIKTYNYPLYNFILENIIDENHKPFLAVIVDGNNNNLEEAFVSALYKCRKKNNLNDIVLNTHCNQAIRKISDWKDNYTSTYEMFIKLVNEPIDKFIKKLEHNNQKAYHRFIELYPQLTAGSEFNPIIGFNVVELYSEFAKKIVEKGYRGIYVVFDEFSKYLETSIASAKLAETKLLQDLAEIASRSGNNQIHFLLITHKEIANYIDKLPKDKVDGWRGVSERFERIEIRNDYAQLYEIIANVLEKDICKYDEYVKSYSNWFNEIASYSNSYKLFSDVDNVDKTLRDVYPLHPITAFILPRISELIAQNERTLFTFLSLNSKNTVYDFIENVNVGFSVITPDILYDYFEPLFRQENYTSDIRVIYNKVSSILHRLDDTLSKKIIKTLSMIYMIKQYDRLQPTLEILLFAYFGVYDAKDIFECIESIENNKYFLYTNASNKYIQIKDTTGVDVRRKCLDEVERINNSGVDPVDLLNNLYENITFYPSQYNDENQVVRYMPFSFLSLDNLKKISDWDTAINDTYLDGKIYGVLYDGIIDNVKQDIINASAMTRRCVFIALSKNRDIRDKIYFCQAILSLMKKSDRDVALVNEYQILLEDTVSEIDIFVNEYIQPEFKNAIYFWNGSQFEINRRRQLSKLLTSICVDIYPNYPIINNEIVNKNNISKIALASRTKLIDAILNDKIENVLSEKGNSQCSSFAKSVLLRTGLLEDKIGNYNLEISLFSNDKMKYVFKEICSKIVSNNSGKGVSFNEIYELLRSYEYGIGLKKGVIPILLAMAISEYKQNIIIRYNGSKLSNELTINAELFNSIDNCPSDYCVIFDTWDSEREKYITIFKRLFDVKESIDGYGSLSILINTMQTWYLNLPGITRQTRKYDTLKIEGFNGDLGKISTSIKKRLHNQILDHRDFIFLEMRNLIPYDNIEEYGKVLQTIKIYHDNYKDNLTNLLIKQIKEIFYRKYMSKKHEICLSSTLNLWYSEMKKKTIENVFSGSVGRFVNLIREDIQDDKICFNKLSFIATGMRIEDWKDSTSDYFLEEIKRFKSDIENYNDTVDNIDDQNSAVPSYSEDIDKNIGYKLLYLDVDCNLVVKNYKKIQYHYPKRAVMLKNEITSSLEEMGEAMTVEEKRQVLFEIINSMQ